MPQRRSPFSYGISNGETSGAAPPMALPMTGTGTEQPQLPYMNEQDQMPPGQESAATLRRRIMPIAGSPNIEPDMLQVVQQMMTQRRGGGY